MNAPLQADICIYGGTACGVIAAVQAARMRRSVIVVVPERRLGGMTSGGLGWTDIGNKRAIGGLAREFYLQVRQHYGQASAWQLESAADFDRRIGAFIDDFVARYLAGGLPRSTTYKAGAGVRSDATSMWMFEPHVASAILNQMLTSSGARVVQGRLDRTPAGVECDRLRIRRILLESGQSICARMYIDSSYEGDLMAGAGVTFRVGREDNADYRETLNGSQPERAQAHQFPPGVDPYIRAGDPASGLLPGIERSIDRRTGEGDRRVQAYNLRACFTNHPENRTRFERPANYDERAYELLFRSFEAGVAVPPWLNAPLPNCKTDTNNWGAVSSDNIGGNYEYANAGYVERERIYQAQLSYQQGLMWTLAYHSRIPDRIREEVSQWGLTRDEFQNNGGWPDQLYVREARRMVGEQVMTEHHCTGAQRSSVAIGLGAYSMDSHHVRRYVDSGAQVRNEGDVQVRVETPYGIDYGAVLPRASECENLLVPVCLSATHIAYGSIRMEPVFMVLGQSVATAASHAIEENASVQRIDRTRLSERLRADAQVLAWAQDG